MTQTLELLGETRAVDIPNMWPDANGNWPMVRADGYSGGDGLHTVSFTVHGFHGKIYLEGTLATEPEERVRQANQADVDAGHAAAVGDDIMTYTDWFPILVGNNAQPFIMFAEDSEIGSTVARTFIGNMVFLRARFEDATAGQINRILVAF